VQIDELSSVLIDCVDGGASVSFMRPHRADVCKLLVPRNVRQQGIAQALMLAAERAAAEEGKAVRVLDTARETAGRRYQRLG
jgi:GNAT superfamily N-acetyltransferase